MICQQPFIWKYTAHKNKVNHHRIIPGKLNLKGALVQMKVTIGALEKQNGNGFHVVATVTLPLSFQIDSSSLFSAGFPADQSGCTGRPAPPGRHIYTWVHKKVCCVSRAWRRYQETSCYARRVGQCRRRASASFSCACVLSPFSPTPSSSFSDNHTHSYNIIF